MAIDLCKSNPGLCSGCGACAAICPKNAISMVYSAEGFLFPSVDDEKCVQCGLCLKVCDFKQFVPTKKKPECFAVRNKDREELLSSRSGGYFMALCKYVIDQQGVVFGCELNEQLRVVHRYHETYEGCKRFKGSKYVQSDLSDTFSACASFLLDGRWVLYSGTGCQVHGLIRYLNCRKVPMEKLITVDLVCHGAPSPGVWENYLREFERREACTVKSVDFRNKVDFGWSAHVETYTMSDNRVINARNWTEGFYRHIVFRESCHLCKYTTTERNSDFTIADYWGIGRNVSEFNDNQGCSLVLIHSEKGKQLFSEITNELDYRKTELKSSMQPQLSKPAWRGWDKRFFWFVYRKKPQKAVSIWFFPTVLVRFVWNVERKGKNLIKRFLHRH